MALLELKNVVKAYQLGDHSLEVLHSVNLSVAKGEFVAIMGPSGSGKSSLLNILGCLDLPSSGEYHFDGRLIQGLGSNALAKIRLEEIGFVFQSFNLLPRYSAMKNVELPLTYSRKKNRKEKVMEILEQVGLVDRAHHAPRQLSGGEMQRVAIARALVNDPKVIFADEPTGNLDSKTGVDIMNLFAKLHAQGRTLVMVTHDDEVAAYAQRRILIRDGEVRDA
ncbi:MAG: ABC transporter ATP-binding protein [Candidatus Nomurabacteria bacterium]|nr:MAG: ABC transporter ATP-binding protein [Candidatus Nomurabacteria bacterium]